MKGKAQGISLIVLVITIIVIIILAGAVILSMMQNNPTTKAKEAIFKTDIATYKDELTMYHLTKTVDALGNYEKTSLNKAGQDLKGVISSIKEADVEKFEIKAGELIYIGTESNEIEWAKEILVNPDDLPEVPEEPEDFKVNAPALAQGMTPIKWNGTDWENTTISDTAWYNYENKEWANAKTADGSFWVWIPRYEYKIENPHTSTAEEIKVNFIKDTKKEATSGYIMHPGFTFGDDELTGIWVAKFEASGSTSAINIKPGVASLRNITISDMFTASRNMETNNRYGWGTNGNGIDTHLMKNIEWGAVAYLSHSKYGKNAEVTINDNTNFYTGGGSGTAYTSNTAQSTTGNITGIYDMNGGTDEYTASYVNNAHGNLTKNGASLINSESKYKDIYQKGSSDTGALNYETNKEKVGDAVYETSFSGYHGGSSWYRKSSYTVTSDNSFFRRGGGSNSSANAGVFSFTGGEGNSVSHVGFRPVLGVNSVL